MRRQIKHEIIAGIDKSELIFLSFTKKEAEQLKWKHSKEFEYKNSMYDIVEADTTNNIVSYWCWWDYEETKLNKQLNKILAIFLTNNNQQNETKNRFANFYKKLFHNKYKIWESSKSQPTKRVYSLLKQPNHSFKIKPPTPPPQHT